MVRFTRIFPDESGFALIVERFMTRSVGESARRSVKRRYRCGEISLWTLPGMCFVLLHSERDTIDGKKSLVIDAVEGHGVYNIDGMSIIHKLAIAEDCETIKCSAESPPIGRLLKRLGFTQSDNGLDYQKQVRETENGKPLKLKTIDEKHNRDCYYHAI